MVAFHFCNQSNQNGYQPSSIHWRSQDIRWIQRLPKPVATATKFSQTEQKLATLASVDATFVNSNNIHCTAKTIIEELCREKRVENQVFTRSYAKLWCQLMQKPTTHPSAQNSQEGSKLLLKMSFHYQTLHSHCGLNNTQTTLFEDKHFGCDISKGHKAKGLSIIVDKLKLG